MQNRTQPPPNRVLDFGIQAEDASKVHTSIEEASPFKPKKSLRRSNGPVRRDLFGSPEKVAQTNDEPDAQPTLSDIQTEQIEEDAPLSVERPGHNGGLDVQNEDYQPMPTMEEQAEEEDAGATSADEVPATPSRQSPNRSRLSGDKLSTGSRRQSPVSAEKTASNASTRKRDRSSVEREEAADSGVSITEVHAEQSQPSQKKKRSSADKGKGKEAAQEKDDSQLIEPSLAAQDDGCLATIPEDEDAKPEQPQPKKKGKSGRPRKTKQAPANHGRRPTSVPVHDSPSKLRQSPSKPRGSSMGPVSNVNLRSTTPFEDAGQRVSRYGRPVMQPLKHWANEHMIYKHGEIEGIVRADEVEKLPPKKAKKKSGPKKTRKTSASRLDDAEEESEAESVLPDEWETEIGVITGEVPAWDPQTQHTDADTFVKEDLGFASSSIVTKEVSGSDFRYAKILTLPFFGSGMVELPPGGFKRAKNSRKMQMVFFVHEGKCMVDVGGNEFAVAKGGVWVVPRGKNFPPYFHFSSPLRHNKREKGQPGLVAARALRHLRTASTNRSEQVSWTATSQKTTKRPAPRYPHRSSQHRNPRRMAKSMTPNSAAIVSPSKDDATCSIPARNTVLGMSRLDAHADFPSAATRLCCVTEARRPDAPVFEKLEDVVFFFFLPLRFKPRAGGCKSGVGCVVLFACVFSVSFAM